MDKEARYAELVAARKICRQCVDLFNPAAVATGAHDFDEIGPWTGWQGNLGASVVLVGQDYSDVAYFERRRGIEDPANRTNLTLVTLFRSIGIDITPPGERRGRGEVYFTNAILCSNQAACRRGSVPSGSRTARNDFFAPKSSWWRRAWLSDWASGRTVRRSVHLVCCPNHSQTPFDRVAARSQTEVRLLPSITAERASSTECVPCRGKFRIGCAFADSSNPAQRRSSVATPLAAPAEFRLRAERGSPRRVCRESGTGWRANRAQRCR